MTLPRAAAAAFLLGLALLVVSESTALRIVALVLIFSGLCAGVVAIATPEFVAGEDEEPAEQVADRRGP